ncbi:MAG TPA: winged helix-turn-helix domain-containing protein [Bryobacteraceae bacterium]|nr:winged helix-turn-helix domain-containing protein [Bryobacteraceae bacterium]
MESFARTPHTVRFGVFDLDLRSGELRKQGRHVRLEGQPVQVLIKLLEKPGELITREDLRKELWPADTFVNFEQSLNAAVKRLRHALGDVPANPRFIETLARRGYRFIAPVSSATTTATSETQRPRAVESLAVLPFANTDADPETEYLADGITESVINHVSRLSSVRVMARSTVFRYKDKTLDPRALGRKLNVDAVLLGRVQQRGDALLVGAELVDVQNGWRLWGEQYNRKLADIFSVEEEMSREISEKLRVRLTGADRSLLAKRYTESTEAYQDYLKGRYHLNRLTEDGLRKGIEYFERAIQRDQNYALAYTGLADSFGLLGFMGLAPAADVMPKAKEAARRAIAIDEGLAEAHASLAGVFKNYDWDWAGAEREYAKALELNPKYANGHRMFASYLAALGRTEQSLRESRLALELDPFSLPIHVEVAYNLYMGRDYERALEEALRTLDLEPQFAPAQSILGWIYEQQGRHTQAMETAERARELSAGHPASVASLSHILMAAGREQQASELLVKLEELARSQHVSPFWMAVAYTGAGKTTMALEELYKAYEQHDVMLVWLGTEPRFDPLRREPRFTELLQRIGLSPSADSAHSGR